MPQARPQHYYPASDSLNRACAAPLAPSTLLVFDGIKMGANITVNGQPVGVAVDQFLRYQYDIAKLLKAGTNELSVTFDFAIDVNGRFMACTGGWCVTSRSIPACVSS